MDLQRGTITMDGGGAGATGTSLGAHTSSGGGAAALYVLFGGNGTAKIATELMIAVSNRIGNYGGFLVVNHLLRVWVKLLRVG